MQQAIRPRSAHIKIQGKYTHYWLKNVPLVTMVTLGWQRMGSNPLS